jgi:hypothetical protein
VGLSALCERRRASMGGAAGGDMMRSTSVFVLTELAAGPDRRRKEEWPGPRETMSFSFYSKTFQKDLNRFD